MNILFDVDGVLINGYNATPENRIRWDENLKKEMGIDPDLLTQHFFNSVFMDVLIGKTPLYQALNSVLHLIAYDGDAQDIIDYWMENDSNINKSVIDIVSRLHSIGLPLYIATNQDHVRAQYLWSSLGFQNYFKDIFYSGKIGHTKPHPQYFNYVNNDLDHQPVLFFDDRIENIEAAIEVGWNACLFQSVEDLANHSFVKAQLL